MKHQEAILLRICSKCTLPALFASGYMTDQEEWLCYEHWSRSSAKQQVISRIMKESNDD